MGESWPNLAARVLRVALARKDVTYAQLAEALVAAGEDDSERALVSRISRGTAEFSLLLQILHITDSEPPPLWSAAISREGSWEQRAAAALGAELAAQPWITPAELTRRLSLVGARVTTRTVARHISSGKFSVTFFLQCLTVLGSPSADRYIDLGDLRHAALRTADATDDASSD